MNKNLVQTRKKFKHNGNEHVTPNSATQFMNDLMDAIALDEIRCVSKLGIFCSVAWHLVVGLSIIFRVFWGDNPASVPNLIPVNLNYEWFHLENQWWSIEMRSITDYLCDTMWIDFFQRLQKLSIFFSYRKSFENIRMLHTDVMNVIFNAPYHYHVKC